MQLFPRAKSKLVTDGNSRPIFLPECLAKRLSAESSLVRAMQVLGHPPAQQLVMMYIAQINRDKPYGPLRCHPLQVVKAFQIDWPGKITQRALASHIEVDVKVTHRQFAQRTIDRLAVAAACVIRFGDGSPVSLDPE